MGFPRQDWSGLPFPSPGDLPPLRDRTQASCIAGDLLYRKQILYGLSHQGSPSNIFGGPFFCHPHCWKDCHPQKGQQRGCQSSRNRWPGGEQGGEAQCAGDTRKRWRVSRPGSQMEHTGRSLHTATYLRANRAQDAGYWHRLPMATGIPLP